MIAALAARSGLAVPVELQPLLVVLVLAVTTEHAVFMLAGTRRAESNPRALDRAAQRGFHLPGRLRHGRDELALQGATGGAKPQLEAIGFGVAEAPVCIDREEDEGGLRRSAPGWLPHPLPGTDEDDARSCRLDREPRAEEGTIGTEGEEGRGRGLAGALTAELP